MNGLWFTSLFLSLTTALVAVLVKQWLHHYVALPSGTPRDRSLTRQFRYAGFQTWQVPVIIGLLPVLMHLALAIFLAGLVVFLHPLREALSWFICVGTVLVYTAYAVATILPILFPQCPYHTPLCDLIYISLHRLVPQVTWYDKEDFLSSYEERHTSDIVHYLPRIRARDPQSLTMIESKLVQQTSTDLAPEALHWLFSASSNLTVQSIVVQSIGGLPMASEEKFRALRGADAAMVPLLASLLGSCLQQTDDTYYKEPVPSMELRLERLLRFHPSHTKGFFGISPNINSFELAVALSVNGRLFINKDGDRVSTDALFMNIISGSASTSKLPPRCWFRFVKRAAAFTLDPDEDDHADMFLQNLCSAILHSFHTLPQGLIQDFESPLVLDFNNALPYFLDKIYDDVLGMFSKFIKHPSLSESSLPQSLKVVVAAIKFLLHRLSLHESNMSHTTICQSLIAAIQWIPYRMFSSQEATALLTVLEDIIAPCVGPPLHMESDWSDLCRYTIRAYRSLATVTSSACSVSGLQRIIDFMTTHWDRTHSLSYESDMACRILINLLEKRIPVAFTAFRECQCLQFFGSHAFHEVSVQIVSAYVAGIFAMKWGSDGAVDARSLQEHIDYLDNSCNRFAACSILATRGVRCVDRTAIHRDITTLVQLCPGDAAWVECRRKLNDLVQSAGGDFSILPAFELQAGEIQVVKDNIRHAIHVLNGIFDGRAHHVPSNLSLEWHPAGRTQRLFGWRLGQKPVGKPEQGRQVN